MLRRLFNFKGLSFWNTGSAVGLNIVWVAGMMIFSAAVTPRTADMLPPDWLGLALILAAFLGPFLIALLIGALASDGRGPTYGILGALVSAFIIAGIILPGNFEIGFIMVAVNLLGGLNGGLMSQRRMRS